MSRAVRGSAECWMQPDCGYEETNVKTTTGFVLHDERQHQYGLQQSRRSQQELHHSKKKTANRALQIWINPFPYQNWLHITFRRLPWPCLRHCHGLKIIQTAIISCNGLSTPSVKSEQWNQVAKEPHNPNSLEWPLNFLLPWQKQVLVSLAHAHKPGSKYWPTCSWLVRSQTGRKTVT